MNKIVILIMLVMLVMLLAIGNAFAEEPSPWANKSNSIKPVVYTECRAGKLFIVAASANGVAIMQIFDDDGDMVPKPQTCECTKEDLRENKKMD